MIKIRTSLLCLCWTILFFNYGDADLTIKEKQILLNAHNYLRSKIAQQGDSGEPTASNMGVMVWSDESAIRAQNWANSCVAGHDSDSARKYGNHWYVGQNWAGASYRPSVYEGVKWWYNEIKDFSFSSNRCSGVCGHYTQIVWSKSTELGCGLADCSSRGGYRYNLVCNYGPGGNVNGARPYLSGNSCSQCSQGQSQCRNGLCAAGSSGVSESGVSNKIIPQSWSEVETANLDDSGEETTTTSPSTVPSTSMDPCDETSKDKEETTTTPTVQCWNRKSDEECNKQAMRGFCKSRSRYHRWMKKNCRKSCGFC
ncbi:UNVERIFIED_CONTAM: hypothetical protein GTU68_031423 [Idotea baltica]|nr:hypothetical protein [Idotea baltica]